MLVVALALCLSALAGAASTGEFRITAPQPFSVRGTALPAGVYEVGLMSNAGVLEITNVDTHATVMVIGNPIATSTYDQPARVTFMPVDGRLTLAQVYLPNGAGFGVPAGAIGH